MFGTSRCRISDEVISEDYFNGSDVGVCVIVVEGAACFCLQLVGDMGECGFGAVVGVHGFVVGCKEEGVRWKGKVGKECF